MDRYCCLDWFTKYCRFAAFKTFDIKREKMKNKLFFVNVIIIFAININLVRADFTAKVRKIVDGDTIHVVDKYGNQFKIRLTGIDAPEKNQAYGLESKNQLSEAINNRWVFLESKPNEGKPYTVDRYKRVLAKVILNGADINLLQISSGYAWHFKRYQNQQSPSDQKAYDYAEKNAKKNQLGLWEEKKPIAPWKWRKIRK